MFVGYVRADVRPIIEYSFQKWNFLNSVALENLLNNQMDAATVNYYSKNAQAVAARYESVVSSLSESFQDAFKARSKLLDIGCGSGRDLALLVSLGHDCFGLDATPEFVELSQKIHPELKGKIVPGALPTFAPPFGGQFDGILC